MSIGFIGNHFYTSSIVERDNAINNLGFVDESHYDSIYIFKQQVRDSKRLYRYFNANVGDHFYCTDQADQQRALSGGYIDESDVDVMYVFGDVISFGAGESPPRTTQLRRFSVLPTTDHCFFPAPPLLS